MELLRKFNIFIRNCLLQHLQSLNTRQYFYIFICRYIINGVKLFNLRATVTRTFSSKESDDPPAPKESEEKTLVPASNDAFNGHPGLAHIHVPEFFPIVPCIAVNKNPVLPKFVKMVEVCVKRETRMFCDSDGGLLS